MYRSVPVRYQYGILYTGTGTYRYTSVPGNTGMYYNTPLYRDLANIGIPTFPTKLVSYR